MHSPTTTDFIKAEAEPHDIVEPETTNEEFSPLRCWDCNVSFMSKYYLYQHLLFHVKQPSIVLKRIQQAPIKITLKSTRDNNFEIITSPSSLNSYLTEEITDGGNLAANDENSSENEECSIEEQGEYDVENSEKVTERDENVTSNKDIVVVNNDSAEEKEKKSDDEKVDFTAESSNIEEVLVDVPVTTDIESENNTQEYGNIPGAEPTPPPEPSPEFPKIRIKTAGLLKESSVTITEITDDNQDGELETADIIQLAPNATDKQSSSNYDADNLWSSSSLEDPLKLTDADKEDGNLLSLFSNNNERAKDLGFTSSDSEFISLDRLDERNHNALQVYNSHPPNSNINQSPLDSLTGLPMQQLAQQVSRLQPGNGMHQQNVLINIQQFPQAPQPTQHGYQPPPMYHPPHQPPMYQPYQYQPPNMYYPHGPGYPPPSHMPPPPPQMSQQHPQQMGQHPQQQMNQHPQQMGQHPQQQMGPQPMQNQYNQQSMPNRSQPMPRQPVPSQRPPMGPRQPMPARQPMQRHRGPVPRPRGVAPTVNIRGPRPRVPQMMGQNMQGQNIQPPKIKRTPEQIQALQAKRKKIDILVPDKNDDADCQVICTQPKNTDGGLPQIQSVQGGTSDPTDNNIMHLSDSITLSVRNPPPRIESPKKSDAKDVANILATRGITVTAAPKPKEKFTEVPKRNTPPPPVAINLNSAVSIIPTAKQTNSSSSSPKPSTATQEQRLPTVDLTDDSPSEPIQQLAAQPKPTSTPQKSNQRGNLPFRCDLCPAQYPNSAGLQKHRQMYHKTGGPCEIGVPLINLKQTGVLQRLSSLGIYNYIPLPGTNPDGTFAIPVINARNPGNINSLGATSILTLGPIRSIPRPQNNNMNHTK